MSLLSSTSVVKTYGSPDVNESIYGPAVIEPNEHCHHGCNGVMAPQLLRELRSHIKYGHLFEESIKDEIETIKYRKHVSATLSLKGTTTLLHPLLKKVPDAQQKKLPKDPTKKIDVIALNKVFDGRKLNDPSERYPITREAAKNQPVFHNGNNAYTLTDFSLNFFHDLVGFDSIDDKDKVVKSFVNTGVNLANAYFDGDSMYYGKGDGKIFGDFTYPFDIGFHEITHGVTQFMFGNLIYQDEAGMLNESTSDVFATIQKQMMLGQKVSNADWKIGLGLLLGKIKDQCLRSMSKPGTAYNNKYMGKDDQPSKYDPLLPKKDVNNEDNGNVHMGSSIGNLVFYLFVMKIYERAPDVNAFSWGKGMQLWVATLKSVPPTCTYPQFASIMIGKAKQLWGEGMEWQAIQEAWTQIGVLSVGRP